MIISISSLEMIVVVVLHDSHVDEVDEAVDCTIVDAETCESTYEGYVGLRWLRPMIVRERSGVATMFAILFCTRGLIGSFLAATSRPVIKARMKQSVTANQVKLSTNGQYGRWAPASCSREATSGQKSS